ncbi:MAG: diphosphomevalonate decarboxylase [Calditrichaceae bacterium]|nr:diphosphomevalonate decarboxylase [Calditrichaceae bacterium]MBN2709753.1 diphosphomevalonate decarboxylase [Calditrichaceae bacterium]RQV94947.1 MAG: diphosphomevalonate decarboxylase [Calditrichota bacterium]
MKITAVAHSNIALVKYWGKRDARLNLPAVGSISLTLDALHTHTSVQFDETFKSDTLFLNGKEAGEKETKRISGFLDLIRARSGQKSKAQVESENNFPTAAGLASSASGFAALAAAASKAAGLSLSDRELSVLARLGSGSAARSVFGGIVEMHKGQKADGSDSFAEPLYPPDYWDLRLLIAVTSEAKKSIGSTDGMTLSKNTSPYYKAWVDSHPADLVGMKKALEHKDFTGLGEISEFSCLKMHALALASNPGMLYWNETTLAGIHLLREIRRHGTEVYFTIDAGPQVKAICLPEAVNKVKEALGSLAGVKQVMHTKLGPGIRIIGEEN